MPLHTGTPHQALTRSRLLSHSAGTWSLTVEGLVLVISPKEPEHWRVDDVRSFKEHLIQKGLTRLNKRLKELTTKPSKPSFMKQLKRRFLASMNPKINMTDVHIRYERLGNVEARDVTPLEGDACACAFGLIMPSMEVRTRRLDEDGHGNGGRKQTDFTMQHSGLYCRTKTMGAASVLPEGYDAESFATEPEPLFDNGKGANGRDGRAYKRTRRRSSASKQRAAAEPSMTAAGGGGIGNVDDMAAANAQEASTSKFFAKHQAVALKMYVCSTGQRTPQTLLDPHLSHPNLSLPLRNDLLDNAKTRWGPLEWLLGPISIEDGGAIHLARTEHKNDHEKVRGAA